MIGLYLCTYDLQISPTDDAILTEYEVVILRGAYALCLVAILGACLVYVAQVNLLDRQTSMVGFCVRVRIHRLLHV